MIENVILSVITMGLIVGSTWLLAKGLRALREEFWPGGSK